ncbi:hypothetical protein EVJ24_04670 [Exiguobacterium sp. SH1S21]|uniref:hypothetical protein n=1 Tax=Exiguobacterium sp. SH1S21 TaxID=2510953 RepID=UPI00103BD73D|nr:hypothetical protein [Exiguobacterium sp. SH1S21]TCI56469.1 hypothetical protein EVJ24_04670 [Exiguobacterium sp. SH1S21]
MDGLWILLLAAFGIASAVMKRLEKSSSTGEKPPSTDLKRYLDTVGDMMKEVDGQLNDPRDERQSKVPQKVRRRVAIPVENSDRHEFDPNRHAPKSREPLPKVSAAFEQAVKIPPITEATDSRKKAQTRISMKEARQAIVWSEILQPPVSKRRRR